MIIDLSSNSILKFQAKNIIFTFWLPVKNNFPILSNKILKILSKYILYSITFFLDLAEVMSVTPATPAPGPPKKTDDKSFFDVSKIIKIDLIWVIL